MINNLEPDAVRYKPEVVRSSNGNAAVIDLPRLISERSARKSQRDPSRGMIHRAINAEIHTLRSSHPR